jgi:twitching motility protein PilT
MKGEGDNMITMSDYLQFLIGKEGSDLHLCSGRRPYIRIHGELVDTEFPIISTSGVESLVKEVLNDEQFRRLENEKETDVSYMLPNISRFRINIYKQRGSYAVTIRVIPFSVDNFEALGIPRAFQKIIDFTHGLVLVTGPQGSGKTTTLAAAIDYINTARKLNIVTVEDPIEFLHKSKKSVINQREIGNDTSSFKNAMKYILRQDVDVCLIGELRDQDTVSAALALSEAGMLVLSTLHSPNCAESVSRIVSMYTPEFQHTVKNQLSLALKAVMSQQLVLRSDAKKGRILACEIMKVNTCISNMIKHGNIRQIYSVIQTSRDDGMKTMDQSLLDLYADGKISRYELIRRAQDIEDIEKQLRYIDINVA